MSDHRLVGADHLQFQWQDRAEVAEARVRELEAELQEALDWISAQGIPIESVDRSPCPPQDVWASQQTGEDVSSG